MSKTIAIVAWGAMADVLYATPIVKYVRSKNPGAKIDWLIRDKFAEVVETNPHINAVVRFALPEGYNSRQDAEYVMDKEILTHAKTNYDEVVDLQYWPRHSNFYENPGEDFISLRARNAGLNPAEIKERAIVSQLTENDVAEAHKFIATHSLKSRFFVTVNHISYAASPVCTFDFYTQLVDVLKKSNVDVVFTGAPHEPIPEGGLDARGVPYRVWQSIIMMSNFYVGLDSGAKTLACATPTPMIILHSKDFPLKKTGCYAMGIRKRAIMELTVIPTPTTLADIILSEVPPWSK